MSKKKTSSSSDGPLACPTCARRYVLDENFCHDCGMPLVYVGEGADEYPASEARVRARKIRPDFTEGRLVRVAGGRNQAEAELIQNLLLEEGVPSILRRSAGFDVPDFLAAGPRDVLVPEAGVETARDVLLESDLAPTEGATQPRAAWVVAGVAGGGVLAALVAWLFQ